MDTHRSRLMVLYDSMESKGETFYPNLDEFIYSMNSESRVKVEGRGEDEGQISVGGVRGDER